MSYPDIDTLGLENGLRALEGAILEGNRIAALTSDRQVRRNETLENIQVAIETTNEQLTDLASFAESTAIAQERGADALERVVAVLERVAEALTALVVVANPLGVSRADREDYDSLRAGLVDTSAYAGTLTEGAP